jgi:hypothetical protein
MKRFYSLQICSIAEQIEKITDIIGVSSSNKLEWKYELIEEESSDCINFIDCFLDLLENKYEQLNEIGITRDDISIWMLYEYDNQCNMEFSPNEMKRLGDNGITLCISCWSSGSYIMF